MRSMGTEEKGAKRTLKNLLRRREYLYRVFILTLIGGLCCGCGNAQEEVMADYAGQEAETSTGTGEAVEGGFDAEAADVGNVLESGGAQGEAKTKDAFDKASKLKDDGKERVISEGNSVSSNSSGRDREKTNMSAKEDTPRREPVKVKGIYVSGPVAGIARMDELIKLVDQTELNAIVIDIKNDEGKVTYKMQSDQVQDLEADVGYIPDIEVLVKKCKEKNIYLIARIVAFRDPYLAEKKPEWAVHTKDGGIFRDKSGLAWVNPYERGVWDYLLEIATEAAAAGFDEIQFDYIRFSTDVKTEEVDYGPEDESIGKIGIITEFTEYMYERLRPLGVYVAADVFGTVIENETDQQIVGQDYVKMAEHLDYICPMVYPSHYRNGSYGIAVPDADPYRTIYGACSASVQELGVLAEENRAQVRAWLQSFTASWVPGHISYGPQQIRAQIKGAYDAGYDEWILWNAAVKYQRDSLLTEEEAEAERQQWEIERKEAEEKEAERQKTEAEKTQEPEEAGEGAEAERVKKESESDGGEAYPTEQESEGEGAEAEPVKQETEGDNAEAQPAE